MENNNNFEIQILVDSSPMSPRENVNLGTLALKWENGDIRISCSLVEYLDYLLGSSVENNYTYSELLRRVKKEYIILPVYMYEHSNINFNTIGFGSKNDLGLLGFIHVRKIDIINNYDIKRITKKHIEQIYTVFKKEVKKYSHWVNGDCYGIAIYKDGDIIDSTYGYYGLDENNGMMDFILDYMEDNTKTKVLFKEALENPIYE